MYVPFHQELTEGLKHEMARASRFIYLEICTKARQQPKDRRGRVEIRGSGVSLAEAIHDLLRGDFDEIVKALPELFEPLNEGEEPMLRVHLEGRRRVIEVIAWCPWAESKIDDSAERVKRHRDKKKPGAGGGDDGGGPRPSSARRGETGGNESVTRYSNGKSSAEGNESVTGYSPSASPQKPQQTEGATVTRYSNGSNGDVTPLYEIRSDQIRNEPNPARAHAHTREAPAGGPAAGGWVFETLEGCQRLRGLVTRKLASDLEGVVAELGASPTAARESLAAACVELDGVGRVVSPPLLLAVIFRRHLNAKAFDAAHAVAEMREADRQLARQRAEREERDANEPRATLSDVRKGLATLGPRPDFGRVLPPAKVNAGATPAPSTPAPSTPPAVAPSAPPAVGTKPIGTGEALDPDQARALVGALEAADRSRRIGSSRIGPGLVKAAFSPETIAAVARQRVA